MSLLLATFLTAAPMQCTPEHAAMGHCKMTPVAKPRAKPAARPKPRPVAPARRKAAPRPKSAPPPAPAPKPAPTPPSAQCTPEHAAMGHCTLDAPPSASMTPPAAPPPAAPPPPEADSGPDNAADAIWGAEAMAPARRAVYAEHGGFSGNRVLIDRLEYRATNGRDGYAWEGDAWFGGDYDRLWLKSEGEGSFGGALDHGEAQALFSRAVSPWFNLQGGVRQDFGRGPDRTHVAFGVQGLAPYWFELDAAVFLSTQGEVTARIEAEYDQRLTNRLILQPRAELSLALQDMPDLRTGAGFTQFEAGLRLRYEIVPEFAPYIGVEWERSPGRTAQFARAAGEDTGGWALVAGIRAWF